MATQLQIRRGTSTQVAAFTGAEGEIVVNTTNDSIVVSDGSTAGGFEMARADLNNVSDTSLNAALTGNTVSALTVTTLTAGAFTSNGIDDNGNATAITIDASENVGIGTSNATPSNGEGMCLGSGSTITRLDIRNSTTGDATGDGTSLQLNGNNFTIENREAGYVAFATSLTERMRINAAGYVNPNANVALTNAPDTQGLHFGWNYSNHAGESLIVFNRGAGSTGGLTFVDNSSSGTHDEVMRIENGTLLVGKTADDNSVGFKTNTDSTYMVASGQTPTFINRLASDGVLLEFRKDSSAVGVIQAKSSQLSIGTGDTGIQTNQAVNAIIPHNTTTNANVDNSIDLGYAAGGTNLRFKDLKLSGGIYLGGVGSANKLDDYEQGSWTSTTTGITGANVTAANYTKIGQLVSCDMRVTWTGSTNDSTALTFSLPFTANNPGGASRTGIVFYQGTSILGGNAISAHVSVGGTVVSFYNTGGGTFRSILASDVNGSYDWLVSFTYFTDL